jgi:hypothetical protein
MSVFEQALAQFPDDDQRKIREVLSRWSRETSLGARVDVNLRLERFLPAVPDMQKLLAVFLGHAHTDWKAFERAYEAACRQKSLRGGEVTLALLPQVLGRAIDRGAWENHLFQNHRQLFANDRRRITRFVDTLLSMPGYALQGSAEGAAMMSHYAAWATWNRNDTTGDPFAFCTTGHGDQIRASLGLVSRRKGRSPELLLLVYERPAQQPLHRPTVADAAKYEYFRPPSPGQGDDHGWTVPWSPGELPAAWNVTSLPPQPEALHQPWPVVLLKFLLRCCS